MAPIKYKVDERGLVNDVEIYTVLPEDEWNRGYNKRKKSPVHHAIDQLLDGKTISFSLEDPELVYRRVGYIRRKLPNESRNYLKWKWRDEKTVMVKLVHNDV